MAITIFTSEDKKWEIWKKDPASDEIEGIELSMAVGIHLKCVKRGGDHAPRAGQNFLVSWYLNEKPRCWDCDTPVPNEIQTLVILHEMGNDNISAYNMDK